jgi:hypothetical protein
VTDWPPWLHAYMFVAAFGLFLLLVIYSLSVHTRARGRDEPEGGGLMLALLWGGLLPGAILLWFLYG